MGRGSAQQSVCGQSGVESQRPRNRLSVPEVRVGGLRGDREGGTGCHHTWLRDWMALDSAAARARLCHMAAGEWEAGWIESLSARDSIMA